VIAVSLFWLFGFALLGWLIFKIAERMELNGYGSVLWPNRHKK